MLDRQNLNVVLLTYKINYLLCFDNICWTANTIFSNVGIRFSCVLAECISCGYRVNMGLIS